MQNLRNYLQVSPEVAQAYTEKKAIVALESTVIAHGLPHPANLEVAARMEEIRAAGTGRRPVAPRARLAGTRIRKAATLEGGARAGVELARE